MNLPASELQAAVDRALEVATATTAGSPADYIPYLANIDPAVRAIAIVTTEGAVYTAGADDQLFATESVSKVFTAAAALDLVGVDAFLTDVGSEPTGFAFDSVMALELHGDRPLSPLVNAGALVTTSMLVESNPQDGFGAVRRWQDEFAGSPVGFSEELYSSEAKTNAHNRAIAWLLQSSGSLHAEPDATVDAYTRGCSTMVTVAQLATMGATLAHRGKNPLSSRTVIAPELAHSVLAEMMMEGLYTESGRWAVTTGVPAKSGVSGAIMAVVPGVAGIAAYAPPLNEAGNSVAASAAINSIVCSLGWSLFGDPRVGPAACFGAPATCGDVAAPLPHSRSLPSSRRG